MYEYSSKQKPGYRAATLEDTVGVINQVLTKATGIRSQLHANTIKPLLDVPKSYTTLMDKYTEPMLAFLKELGLQPVQKVFYALQHAEGIIVIQADPRGCVLRFVTTTQNPSRLYVTGQADPEPSPKLDKKDFPPGMLEMLKGLLTPEQLAKL